MITLPVRGANKRYFELLKDVAIISYLIAQKNGNWRSGEIHVDSTFSSKHHNFKYQALKIWNKYEAQINERRCEYG